jgi:diaminopimelate epimerase
MPEQMKMRFTKMHGLGNDFILIDCIREACQSEAGALGAFARRLCHRRLGIGADQLLLLLASGKADFRMRIFNADGSEVEMCGNGIRCLAKYIWDRNLSDKNVLEIETPAGSIRPEKSGDMVRVDMGEPVFESDRIPVDISVDISSVLDVQSSKGRDSDLKSPVSNPIIDYPLKVDDKEFHITCVSMGNPHVVIVVDEISGFPVGHYGPLIERHPIFPRRTNVEFMEVLNGREIRMRVWERGSGETTACGTGASAVAVASHLKGLTERNVTVHLSGGDLYVEWSGDNHIYMTGPAEEVFEGVVNT